MSSYGLTQTFPEVTGQESPSARLARFDAWFKDHQKHGRTSEEDGMLAAFFRSDLRKQIAAGDPMAKVESFPL